MLKIKIKINNSKLKHWNLRKITSQMIFHMSEFVFFPFLRGAPEGVSPNTLFRGKKRMEDMFCIV